MGTAFCFPAADAGHSVQLVGTHLDGDWIKSIQQVRIHPKLNMKLPESVTALLHDQLGDAMSSAPELIVIGVSSAGVSWAIEQLGPGLKTNTPILMLTKGLEAQHGSLQIFPEAVRKGLSAYSIERLSVGAVGGPCIARELAARCDTSVVISYSDEQVLQQVVRLLGAPYYHVRPSTDVVGIEVCAALKNFYTLAVGAAAGLFAKQGTAANGALMHNPAAGLFTQALTEMSRMVQFLGGTEASVLGLAGAGDLYVTCQAGRNSRMGHLLGSGLPYSVAKAGHMAEETVEGAELAFVLEPVFADLFGRGLLAPEAFPLAVAVIDAICHDAPMALAFNSFHRI
jgi:glycerol-3-phosphate dehydrogenase (NAD(P)+)